MQLSFTLSTGKRSQDSEDSTSPIGKHNIQQLPEKIGGIIIVHEYCYTVFMNNIVVFE